MSSTESNVSTEYDRQPSEVSTVPDVPRDAYGSARDHAAQSRSPRRPSPTPVSLSYEERLTGLQTDVEQLKVDGDGVYEIFNERLSAVEAKVESSFANVVSSINAMLGRMDAQFADSKSYSEGRFNSLHGKMISVTVNQEDFQAEVLGRLSKLEGRFDVMEGRFESFSTVAIGGFSRFGELVKLVEEQQVLVRSVIGG